MYTYVGMMMMIYEEEEENVKGRLRVKQR